MTSDSQSPSASFFTDLGNRGFEPLLAHATGSLGVDLIEPTGTEHWHVEVDRGKVTVSHRSVEESAYISMAQELFDQAVQGRTNLWTAMLRGSIDAGGDLHLIALFQRLFPGPQSSGGS